MKTFTSSCIFLFALILQPSLHAQDKLLTLEDISGMNRDVFPARLQNIQWRGESNLFTWIAGDCLVSGTVSNETRDTILRFEELKNRTLIEGGDTLKRFPSVSWLDADKFYFDTKNKVYTCDLNSREVRMVNGYNEKAQNTDIEPHTFAIAYTIENNLFITLNGEEIKVTNDEDKGIVNGQEVSRNEFGINKGTFWSPDGHYLAFYRMDETGVTNYPLVDIDVRPAGVKDIKYPMAGMTSQKVTVGIFNPVTKEKIFLQTGEPSDQYLTNITWSPDERYIFIAVLNRDQNHVKLNQYDVSTGTFIKTLFEETDKDYVEPLHGLYFLHANPNRFLWFSEKDRHNHLYLYDTDGHLIKQVTRGPWDVLDLLGTDPADRKVYYISNEERPVEQHIYSIDLKTGKTVKISSVSGTHNALLSNDGRYVIDECSSLSSHITHEYILADEKGIIKQTLLANKDPLKDYNLEETTIFTIKDDQGDDLYGRLIKPTDFDPAKKYPVLIYVYGGPHSQLVTDSWLGGAGLFLNYMAEHGYVVFTLDNRGTSNRGMDFEQAIFRHLGVVEAEDQMQGIRYLKTLPFIDTTRIGVTGWSYGGFMTINMMLRYPGVFKAGCCGGPVTDWKYYEVMYGERYMDTPQDNPEGYEESSLLNKAGNLTGKLLIIHGTMDPTVVWQNSLMFIKRCIQAGVQVDYFVYPDQEHGIGGKDRLHLNTKMIGYFLDNL
jgi:dipeptidyl-peptidase-4